MAIYIEKTLAKFMNLSEKLATELNHFLKTITYENNGELDSSLNEEERQKFKRCWYCGSDPGRQSHPQSRHTSNSGRQCIF